LVVLLDGVARLVGRALEARLARVALLLAGDAPQLDGPWVVEFDDPTPGGGRKRSRVHVRLKQFGHRVRGTGHLERSPTDTFTFHGTIRRNVLYGSYQRDDAHNLAGTGTFVLKIVAHSRAMEGQCLWYDGGLDAVWASGYGWKRAR